MEPMTLGSPVGSPISSSAATLSAPPASSTNAFLPAYLMGDTQSTSSVSFTLIYKNIK